jgi:hypothetical protein
VALRECVCERKSQVATATKPFKLYSVGKIVSHCEGQCWDTVTLWVAAFNVVVTFCFMARKTLTAEHSSYRTIRISVNNDMKFRFL